MPSNINQRIINELKRNKLTMRDLAKLIGVCQPTISRWCTGKREPRIQQIIKMAEVFGVSVSWLAFGNTNINNGTIIIPFSGTNSADENLYVIISKEACKRIFNSMPENLSLFNLKKNSNAPINNSKNLYIVDKAVHEVTAIGLYLVEINGIQTIRQMQPLQIEKISLSSFIKNRNLNNIDATQPKILAKVIASIYLCIY